MTSLTDFHHLRELVDPYPIHVVGLGVVGSRIVDILDTKNIGNIHAWDGGVLKEHNLRNQRFAADTVGLSKPEAALAWSKKVRGRPAALELHGRHVTAADALSGIVLCGVDSMVERQNVFAAAKRGGAVFFGDVRLGPDGGKVYGLWPENIQHEYRYLRAPHMHADPTDVPQGACKSDFPVPEIADIAVGNLFTRLADWMALIRGAEAPYMNFYAFAYRPVFQIAYEFWNETSS